MSTSARAIPGATSTDSPFVGLTYYTEDQAASFFGREAERKMIIGNLRASRLTLLYAQSGVGKSSLLRAGVAARLGELARRSADERGSPRFVPVVFAAWRDDPVAGLVDRIWEAVDPFLPNADAGRPTRGTLEDHVAAATAAVDATLLVVLDQFEEYFLYHPREARPGTFGDELARCVNIPDLRANWLIAIREDAYAALGDLFVGRIANVYGNYLHLEYLERHAARQAIVKPIELFNEDRPEDERVAVEPALVETVLDSVARGMVVIGESGRGSVERDDVAREARFVETSYLQLVMDRLWGEERAAGSRTLRLETLQALGGADTIIRSHLDEAMADLPAEQQDVAAAAFRYLATPSGSKIALSVPDLAQLASVDPKALALVIEHLCGVRILRPVVAMAKGDATRYEIFHDVLAAAVLDWRARYARAQEEQAHAARLEAEKAEREQAQREALEAQAREERERRRARIFKGLTILCALLAVAAVAALVFAAMKSRDADRQAKRAESTVIAVRADSLPVGLAALGGLEAYGLSPSVDALSAIHSTLGANAAVPTVLSGHSRSVNGVAFSPTDGGLASASSDGSIRLWEKDGDLRGQPLRAAEDTGYNAVTFSPDGATLVGVSDAWAVDLWDMSDPRQPILRQTKLECATRVAFSADGRMFACGGGPEGTAVMLASFDGATAKPLSNAEAPDAYSEKVDVALSRDGGLLAAAADYDGVELWDVSRPAQPRLLWRSDAAYASAVAFAADGRLLAVSDDSDIVLYDVTRSRKPRPVRRLLGHADTVGALAFSPDGALLVSGSDDSTVISWDVATGQAVGPPRSHPFWWINDVAFAADGVTFASAGDDGDVKLWSTSNPRTLATTVADPPAGDPSDVYKLALSGSGVVAAATLTGVHLWPVAWPQGTGGSPPPGPEVLHEGESALGVAYHDDILAVGHETALTLWDTSDVRNPQRLAESDPATDEIIIAVAFDADGAIVATGDEGGDVSLWDAADRRRVRLLSTFTAHKGKDVYTVAFDPHRDVLATAGADGLVRLWNVEDPKRPVALGNPLDGHDRDVVYALSFAPDGDVLASSGGDQQVVFWDVSDPTAVTQIGQPHAQSNSILELAFSPDGAVLAAADADSSVVIWDAKTRQYLGEFQGPVGEDATMGALAFDADGRFLLSSGRLNPIVAWGSTLWSRDEAVLRPAVCALAGGNLGSLEWHELFAGTRLEDERRATCPGYPLPD